MILTPRPFILDCAEQPRVKSLLLDAVVGDDIQINWPVLASARLALINALAEWEPKNVG